MWYSWLFVLMFLFSACYSFKGGSVPAHLKTIQIMSVIDNSGFGSPEYKVDLESELLDKFQKDGALKPVQEGADAKISVIITSIQEAVQMVGSGELETERKLTVTVSAEYYDNIHSKQIWKKNFSAYSSFDVNKASLDRKTAMENIIPQLAEDIVLGVVSGW